MAERVNALGNFCHLENQRVRLISTAHVTASKTPIPSATLTPPPTLTPSLTPTAGTPSPKAVTAQFIYDGDGNRVVQTIDGVTTYFIGSYYEVTAGVATKYYYSGGSRIAMRRNGTLYYVFSDHLGSTSITTDSAGNVISELRYKPWGETRYTGGNTPTQYTFTGQRDYTSDFGLMYFNARWVDVSTGRFAQADTIIPQGQGVQAWDRYAFVNNNPVRYIDPSGHMADDGDDGGVSCKLPGTCPKVYGPPLPSHRTYHTSFQMYPFLPNVQYSYSEASNESYTGFSSGGEPEYVPEVYGVKNNSNLTSINKMAGNVVDPKNWTQSPAPNPQRFYIAGIL